MSAIVGVNGQAISPEPTEKQLEVRAKQLRQLLFTIKQQAMKHGRERFYGHGEIAEFSTPVQVAGKTVTFIFRYDPLNDSLVPVGYA